MRQVGSVTTGAAFISPSFGQISSQGYNDSSRSYLDAHVSAAIVGTRPTHLFVIAMVLVAALRTMRLKNVLLRWLEQCSTAFPANGSKGGSEGGKP